MSMVDGDWRVGCRLHSGEAYPQWTADRLSSPQRDAPDAEQAKPTYLKLWRSGSRHGLRIERSGDEECNDRTPLDPRANTSQWT
jgi:hypothetical protein